jgi:hypothetical protein
VTDRRTVGATRAFLAAHYGVPHEDDTHYVLVAEAVNGMTVGTCCDGLDEATGMLRAALREIGKQVPGVAPGSPSVIVGRDDLKAALLAAGALPLDILQRLCAALGKDTGDEH